ncbi:sensor histidine kinase [Kitasatospora sp. NPDC059646]|uniref:sensor histidine kinase n=1 Tax=Kitasatospora sp. NPDC059646 TaxID=3346893 RepID=UPI0036B41204
MELLGHHRRSAPWRGLGYLLGALGTAVATVVALPVLLVPRAARGWADLQRARAERLLGAGPAGPVRVGGWRVAAWLVAGTAGGLAGGAFAVLCAGNTVTTAVTIPLWRALPAGTRAGGFGWGAPLSGWGDALTAGTAQLAAFAAATYWLVPPLARQHARMCTALLSPSAAERLARQVAALTETRADAMNAHGAELRRIERDLHDGAQARLVAIAMRLGVARELLDEEPHLVAKLLAEAQQGTEDAMAELRAVIRTIYPPILADRGLAGALAALTAGAAIDADLEVGPLGPVPAAVEAVAYFAVAEALTNAAKHSGASRAGVRLARDGDWLTVTVADDGVGGADATRGTGLAGIRHRVRALDGTVEVHSPVGGPTRIEVGLPCGS